jgi:hypothetical protein
MTIYLNDTMLDLNEPVVVVYNKRELSTTEAVRDRIVIQKTLRDPKDYYTAQIQVELP